MLLGGLRYLLPVIEVAHKQGYHVITADYLPQNIAHKYSDEYVNVSIVDKEAVLRVAKRLKIDGIMSFPCDPGVVAASYVQNQMGLPSFGPFESVEILQNKDRFRAFLTKHGFNVPVAKGFDNVDSAMEEASAFPWPIIVKPTDSAGSKGCSRVDHIEELRPALEKAMCCSFSNHVIVEEFLEKQGFSSDSDSMSIDGKLAFTSFNAQRFDPDSSNPFTPASYSWPTTFSAEQRSLLISEIQRLITLLDLKTAVFNIEALIGKNGKPYLMELTPRGGGNRLCEMLKYITGVDLITAITRYIAGDSILEPLEQEECVGHWAEIILHSNREGVFDRIEIDSHLPATIVEKDLWVKHGDKIGSFQGANAAIGTMVLRFDNQHELEYCLANQGKWLKIVTE